MARPHLIPSVQPTERLVGQAPTIVALRAQIRHLVTFDTLGNPFVPTVLLQGETGTGKGLVARVIHESGPRAQGPFVEVNCAAIPESLLEAELFGFEAGAFTDARRAKPGLWEAASGGILFLDEIDALPLTLQSKLLTVIEAKRVRRLGAVVEHPIRRQAHRRHPGGSAGLRRRGSVPGRSLPSLGGGPIGDASVAPTGGGCSPLGAAAFAARCWGVSAVALNAWTYRPSVATSISWPGNVRELGHLMERVTLLHPDPLIGLETLEQFCIPLPKSFAPASARPPKRLFSQRMRPRESSKLSNRRPAMWRALPVC